MSKCQTVIFSLFMSLFADDMMFYIKNSKDTIYNRLELIKVIE